VTAVYKKFLLERVLRHTATGRKGGDLERFDVNVPLVAMVTGPNHYTALM
jgi:hypothetical protein